MTTLNPRVYQCLAIANGLKFYAKHGMRINRMYTPDNMLQITKQITGKVFKRGQYMEASAALMDYAKQLNSTEQDI